MKFQSLCWPAVAEKFFQLFNHSRCRKLLLMLECGLRRLTCQVLGFLPWQRRSEQDSESGPQKKEG